jgi:hypothetical protein
MHSSVREAVGIPFEEDTYPQSFVLTDVRMRWALPEDEAPPEPSLSDVQALLDARGPRTPRPLLEEVL